MVPVLSLRTGFAPFPPLTGCFNPLAYKQVQQDVSGRSHDLGYLFVG